MDRHSHQLTTRTIPGPGACRHRVLVGEDDRLLQRIVRRVLSDQGHQVEVVPNGAELVRRYREGGAKLVLTDMFMPGMTGLEAIQQIRDHQRRTGEHVPVLVMSADEGASLNWADLADDFIPKPIVPHRLLDTIRRLLGVRAA